MVARLAPLGLAMDPSKRTAGEPDVELGVRLIAGDPSAIGDLYDALGGTVLAMARRALQVSMAEDVLQDVFIQVWTRRLSYDPSRGPLTPWILRIARNRITDLIRASRARPQTEPLESDNPILRSDSEPLPEQAVWASEQRRVIQVAMTHLSIDEQNVIRLAYYGYSQSEISDQLTVPLGTVKTRTRAALRKLREHLERMGIVDTQ